MITSGRLCITQVDEGKINSCRETFNTAPNRITVLNVHKVDRNEIRMSPVDLNEKRNGLWHCTDTITHFSDPWTPIDGEKAYVLLQLTDSYFIKDPIFTIFAWRWKKGSILLIKISNQYFTGRLL